jgi:small subunit ribosomal protein S19
MSRSKWKGPYIKSQYLKTKSQIKKQYTHLIASRNSEITSQFIGLTFNIYNGKKHTKLNVTKDMIGHKFGEFAQTRATFHFKKKSKKK